MGTPESIKPKKKSDSKRDFRAGSWIMVLNYGSKIIIQIGTIERRLRIILFRSGLRSIGTSSANHLFFMIYIYNCTIHQTIKAENSYKKIKIKKKSPLRKLTKVTFYLIFL